MNYTDLKTQILDNEIFDKKATATGFYKCVCPVCDDSVKRAGVKFSKNLIIYSCFRGKCDNNIVYDFGTHVSKKFRTLMDKLEITLPPELLVSKHKQTREEIDTTLYEKHAYVKLPIPNDFVKYNKEKHLQYRHYLERRGMYDGDYYIGVKGDWRNKLIIPFRLNHKTIFWQGVDIRTGKYFKASGNSDVIYSTNNSVPKEPIIVEGVFDAKSVPDGIAVLQNTVSKKQAYFLRNSSPILLPDRKYSKFLDVAKKYGWRVSIPEWKEKDANDAIQKYGKFVVAKMIHDGIQPNRIAAEVMYKMWKQ